MMLKSEKNLRELKSGLAGKSIAGILETIRLLRNNAPFKGAISALTEAYDRSENRIVKEHIRNFLNDIKDPELRSDIITEIKRDYQPDTAGMLLASCWQSGLDYSPYADELVLIFIKYDYSVAIECFTVIEESVQRIPVETRKKIISTLKESLSRTSADKLPLIKELISVMNV